MTPASSRSGEIQPHIPLHCVVPCFSRNRFAALPLRSFLIVAGVLPRRHCRRAPSQRLRLRRRNLKHKRREGSPSNLSFNAATPLSPPKAQCRIQPAPVEAYSSVSAPKAHGRILVLTRTTPKPVTPPTPQPQHHHQSPPNPIHQTQDQSELPPDTILLHPLGRTSTASSLSSLPVINHDNKDMPSSPPKSDKFVSPHLWPGFVPREETHLGRVRSFDRCRLWL
ncbi:hypothetical protein VIGAN_11130200 [Vigna angularis var. angularis]|uniref:Uncharacterized protein n=1 Tax=Vigna angularis var. angularis TaxID=157739 RepID=A0A0S3TAT7_PHAAN|nr:hypothetical protein VIGAN_11130200 [Vigna angularis var. angularis]